MSNPIKRAKNINGKWSLAITNWEKLNGRKFSWRENRTPYRVLIAEILLKRTTSTAAIKLYDEFLKKYPDINSLFHTSASDLSIILRPIGLYNQRSNQLKQIASYIINNFGGELPDNYKSLIKIPGVGEYTASSILCFCYGKNKAIIDSNVERILYRSFLVRGKEMRNIAEILIDKQEPEVYNYGMLDLGAIICHYKYPKCPKCPVKDLCETNKKNHRRFS